MRIVIFLQKGTYFAEVVESNGDEHELTRSHDFNELHTQIKSLAPGVPVEYHEDVIPPLVGQKEACEILGWEYPKNRSMINTYLKRGKFPKPIQSIASGPLWFRRQIEDYRDSRK